MTKKIPAYISLYQSIQKKIVSGAYAYSTKIPSKRVMSEEEGVSLATVEHAYELLEEEGYIASKERSGYYVCYKEEDVFESVVCEEDIQVDDRSASVFPMSVFAKASRKVLMMIDHLPERSDGQGNPSFRNAISNYLKRSRDIDVDPEQIIVGAGSEYLYSLLIDLLGRSRIYGIETPSYDKIYNIYRTGGCKVDRLKLGSNGILSSELKRTPASILHVTPFHSFPTGSSTDASKRREYVHWAETRNAFIIEDDYASEFSPSVKAEETLFSLDGEHVIYMNTFTKTISSSIRVGYMILPLDLLEEYRKTQAFRSCTVSEYIQLILTELLNNGSFERNLNRIRRKQKQNRK